MEDQILTYSSNDETFEIITVVCVIESGIIFIFSTWNIIFSFKLRKSENTSAARDLLLSASIISIAQFFFLLRSVLNLRSVIVRLIQLMVYSGFNLGVIRCSLKLIDVHDSLIQIQYSVNRIQKSLKILLIALALAQIVVGLILALYNSAPLLLFNNYEKTFILSSCLFITISIIFFYTLLIKVYKKLGEIANNSFGQKTQKTIKLYGLISASPIISLAATLILSPFWSSLSPLSRSLSFFTLIQTGIIFPLVSISIFMCKVLSSTWESESIIVQDIINNSSFLPNNLS